MPGFAYKTILWVLLPLMTLAYGYIIRTNQGYIRGYEGVTRDLRSFYYWRGIPYAEPPVGQLRFESPVPARSWRGVREGRWYSSKCAQIDPFFENIQGSEDCLFINVHAPKVRPLTVRPLPVIFAIHGGYFYSGQGREIGPDYLLDEEIVLVTFNFRQSILGFLNTGDKTAKGNMGLKDVRLALKWTYENIQYFGGDPQKITVLGHASGGSIANLLFIANSTRPYVHKAISMSGTALTFWIIKRNPRRQAKLFAKTANCPTEDTQAMISCLKNLDVEILLKNIKNLSFIHAGWDWNTDFEFTPTVEDVVDTNDTFLSANPLDLVKSGDFKPVPWIVSVTSAEALIYMAPFAKDSSFIRKMLQPDMLTRFATNYLNWPPLNLTCAEKIEKHYYGVNGYKNHSPQAFKTAVYFASTLDYFLAAQDSVVHHASKAPVYALYNNKSSQISLADITSGIHRNPHLPSVFNVFQELTQVIIKHNILRKPLKNFGVANGDDMLMLSPFQGILRLVHKLNRDYKFSKQFVKIFADFATDKKHLHLREQIIRPFNPSRPFSYFALNDDNTGSGLTEMPFRTSYIFWKNILNKDCVLDYK